MDVTVFSMCRPAKHLGQHLSLDACRGSRRTMSGRRFFDVVQQRRIASSATVSHSRRSALTFPWEEEKAVDHRQEGRGTCRRRRQASHFRLRSSSGFPLWESSWRPDSHVLRSSGAAGVGDEARETLDDAVNLFLVEKSRVSVNVSHIQSLGKHISF